MLIDIRSLHNYGVVALDVFDAFRTLFHHERGRLTVEFLGQSTIEVIGVLEELAVVDRLQIELLDFAE